MRLGYVLTVICEVSDLRCKLSPWFVLIKVFQLCDVDKKGYLSGEDMKLAVVMLFGYKPSKVNFALPYYLKFMASDTSCSRSLSD